MTAETIQQAFLSGFRSCTGAASDTELNPLARRRGPALAGVSVLPDSDRFTPGVRLLRGRLSGITQSWYHTGGP